MLPDWNRTETDGPQVRTRASMGLVAMCLLLAFNGCAWRRGNADLLEARLHQQEQSISRLESQLESSYSDLAAARADADAVRNQLQARGESTLLPEQADVLYRVNGIRFQKLLTGGLDRDGAPGDEMLTAVLMPVDGDGESLKLPGTIELTLLDLSLPTDQQRIGNWWFSADESRAYWHSGFLGSGFRFSLPWQQIPSSKNLILHARLTTTDDRQFDTSTELKVQEPTLLVKNGGSDSTVVGRPTSNAGRVRPVRFESAERSVPIPIPEAQPSVDSDEFNPFAPPQRDSATGDRGVIDTSDSWTEFNRPQIR